MGDAGVMKKCKMFKSQFLARVIEERSKLFETGTLCGKVGEAIGETFDAKAPPNQGCTALERQTCKIRLARVFRAGSYNFLNIIELAAVAATIGVARRPRAGPA